jgi:hypothetical protein
MGLPVEKSEPVPTGRPKEVATPRFEQVFRAIEGSYRRAKGSEPEAGDFFNRQGRYRNQQGGDRAPTLSANLFIEFTADKRNYRA